MYSLMPVRTTISTKIYHFSIHDLILPKKMTFPVKSLKIFEIREPEKLRYFTSKKAIFLFRYSDQVPYFLMLTTQELFAISLAKNPKVFSRSGNKLKKKCPLFLASVRIIQEKKASELFSPDCIPTLVVFCKVQIN